MSERDDCPFVGLPPFSDEHARYFFGREHDATLIVDNLLARPVTVLYGASGTGKSSILNVGIPAILQRELGQFGHWPRSEWQEPAQLTGWLDKVVATAKPEQPLILIFDQFEEYFLYRTAATAEEFERPLASLLSRTDLEVHLLLSLRSDALHLLDGLRLRFHTVMDNTIELKHLDEVGIREAIEGPIRVYNDPRPVSDQIILGEGFTDHFIAELVGSLSAIAPQRPIGSQAPRVELPFMQLAMQRLWRRLPTRHGSKPREITPELLATEGGVNGVVGTHVKEKLDSLSQSERGLASQIFHYLVTPSGGKFAHSPQDLADLASESAGERIRTEVVGQLLSKLAEGDARILRQAGDRFELFHDVLARPILNWRVDFRKSAYLDEAPFGSLIGIFSNTRISLRGSGVLIGRYSVDDDDTWPLAYRPVSRTQLLIMRDGQVLDLRSRFGTTINANPIHFGETEAYLRDGDIVGFANTAAVIYRTTVDEESAHAPLPQSHSATPRSWGVLIDGGGRRYFWLDGSAIDLVLDKSGIVARAADSDERPFAKLTAEKEKVWLTSLAGSLEVIERADSYSDRAWHLDPGKRFEVDLKSISRPNPETMGDLEGAHRAVFRISGKGFEIMIKHQREQPPQK